MIHHNMPRTLVSGAFLIAAVAAAALPAAAQTVPLNARASSQPSAAETYQQDAQTFVEWINLHYAYLDRLPGKKFTLTPPLAAESAQVHDRTSLVRFMERALLTLADNHAITRTSLPDSWAVIPSYSDLWIERKQDRYIITAVRDHSPAAAQSIKPGGEVVTVTNVPIAQAVTRFWADLGSTVSDDALAGYAARTLAAGKRRQPRILSIKQGTQLTPVTLASLYTNEPRYDQRLTATQRDGRTLIRFNDSLGEQDTIAAFDAAMAAIPRNAPVTLDFTNTPGGGNSSVARGIMGWFVRKPSPYQIHDSPREFRYTGIDRRWTELVMPREGKLHTGPVEIKVGRWTGSMGEGLGIGFNSLGAKVRGDPMAGLIGAVDDFELPNSKIGFKLPTERLFAVDGTPRENFRPRP